MSSDRGELFGRVVDVANRPVSGAAVAVSGTEPHPDIAAVTSADGRFHFGRLKPGAYRVAAHAGGRSQSADVVVTAGARLDVEIRFER